MELPINDSFLFLQSYLYILAIMPRKNIDPNPRQSAPQRPNYKRRAYNHDYTKPARYMLTLFKADDIPTLSAVKGDISISDPNNPNSPAAIVTKSGECIVRALHEWHARYLIINVDEYVIMPDHIHLCVNVRFNLDVGLSRAVANLMGMTTKAYSELIYGKGTDKRIKFFKKGFTDSIAYSDDQYNNQRKYVTDNPRRLLMKRAYPDLYRRKWLIKIGDMQLMAVGNIFLLKNPHIEVVRFSGNYSEGQVLMNLKRWERCIDNGGALISPFIHPKENDMRKKALARCGNIIRICENGFSERFAPALEEFNYMGTKHLLLIGPAEYSTQKIDMKRNLAMRMNLIAEMIANHPENMRISPAN